MLVLVIGGGIFGASIVWHLRDNADVTVIDCGALWLGQPCLTLNATFVLTMNILNPPGIQAWRDISTKLPNLPPQWNDCLGYG